MRRTLTWQLLRFAAVGVLGVGAYLALFALLLGALGPQASSLLARLVVAFATSWVNVRVSFSSREPVWRAFAAGLAGLGLGAGLAAVTLMALQREDPHPTHAVELLALGTAQLLAAVARFALLRRAAFPAHEEPTLIQLRDPQPTVRVPKPSRPLPQPGVPS